MVVWLRNSDGRANWIKTDASGVARFSSVPEATYEIEAQEFETQTISVTPGTNLVRLVKKARASRAWKLRPESWIVRERSRRHIVTTYDVERKGGGPIFAVVLDVLHPDRERVIDLDPTGGGRLTLTADGDDVFEVRLAYAGTDYSVRYGLFGPSHYALPAGTYRLSVDGFMAREFTIEPGQDRRIEIRTKRRRVRMTVQYEDGAPAIGARVVLHGKTAAVSSNGSVIFPLVAPGEHVAHVTGIEGRWTLPVRFEVENEDIEIAEPIVLRRAAARIRILDPGGAGPAQRARDVGRRVRRNRRRRRRFSAGGGGARHGRAPLGGHRPGSPGPRRSRDPDPAGRRVAGSVRESGTALPCPRRRHGLAGGPELRHEPRLPRVAPRAHRDRDRARKRR